MKTKYLKWCRLAIFFLLFSIVAESSILCANAAANKSLKLIKASFADASVAENRFKGAELCAAFPKTDKLKKSGMKFSGTFYFPVHALKEPDDRVSLDAYIYLQKPNASVSGRMNRPVEQWPSYVGFVETQYNFIVRLNDKKKIEIMKCSWATGKVSKAGKYASVKKTGKYYKVTLKNVPLSNNYYNAKGQEKPVVTNKKYLISPSFILVSATQKAWSGSLYIDNVKVKTAKKTQAITFNNKNYSGLYVSNWASGTAKYKITTPMK